MTASYSVTASYSQAYQLAITIKCPHCDERIAPLDPIIDNLNSRHHAECFIRMIAGSARHQLRQCSCYGYHEDEEPGLTRRQWARRAAMVHRTLGLARSITSLIDGIEAARQSARDTAFSA